MKPRAKQPETRRKRTNHRRMAVISLAFICLLETGFLVPVIAWAQESRRIPKLGYLWAGYGYSNRSAFHQELRKLGYVEGKNILIEYRVAEGNYDRLSDLAAELVRLQVDVIFANSTLSARSAKEATQTIPIVMYSGDPVREKLVASLARPGGNITGVTNLSRELSMKRLELVKEIVPRAVVVAVLWDPDGPVPLRAFRDTELAAQTLSIKILSLQVRSPAPNLKGAFDTASKSSADALVVISNPLTIRNRKQRTREGESSPGDVPGRAMGRSGRINKLRANGR